MGLFGRKKKEAGIIEEAEDNENEESLDLAYGNCLDETSHRNEGDSSSVGGDSLPPPPPHKSSKKQKQRSHDDTFDEDHSEHDSLEEAIEVNDPSIETAIPRGRDCDDMSNISVTFEPDYVVKGQQHRRRNKMLLMLACCVSFCLIIGLAAGYGSSAAKNKQQEQSSSFSELNSSESEVNTNGSTDTSDNTDVGVVADSTIASSPNIGGAGEEEADVPTNSNMSTDEQAAEPPEGAAAAAQQETTEETATAEKNIVPNVVTAPTDPSSSSIETVIDNTDLTSSTTGGDAGIPATTADADTYTNTQGSNSNGMPMASAVPTLSTSVLWVDPNECTFDQITASSHCENGIASTSIFMCLGRDTRLNDQFWAWSEVPVAYQAYQDRDWGWLGDYDASRNREITGLPNGRYVLGLYADGNGPVLEQYPLLASSEFTIACGV